jgi:uncharacterized protein YjbJ (UPF0337 family)
MESLAAARTRDRALGFRVAAMGRAECPPRGQSDAGRPAWCRSLTSQGVLMAEQDTGPEAGVKGAVEGVKGKVKEAAGALSGKDELRREGQAQQDKAEAQRDVAAKEAEAEKARGEAEAHEAEQRSHQH